MTKILNHIIFFSSTKIRIFFSATLGIRIFFLEKNHNPPLQVKWSVPNQKIPWITTYVKLSNEITRYAKLSNEICTTKTYHEKLWMKCKEITGEIVLEKGNSSMHFKTSNLMIQIRIHFKVCNKWFVLQMLWYQYDLNCYIY